MTQAELFRYGFLKRCAEEGLDVAAADARAATFMKAGATLGGVAGTTALALGLGAPLLAGVVGYQGGRALGRLDNDPVTKESLEAEEKIALYRRLAEKLRREQAVMMPAGKK